MAEECSGESVGLAVVAFVLATLIVCVFGRSLLDYLFDWTIVNWQYDQDPVARGAPKSLFSRAKPKMGVFKMGQVLPRIEVTLSHPFARLCGWKEEEREEVTIELLDAETFETKSFLLVGESHKRHTSSRLVSWSTLRITSTGYYRLRVSSGHGSYSELVSAVFAVKSPPAVVIEFDDTAPLRRHAYVYDPLPRWAVKVWRSDTDGNLVPWGASESEEEDEDDLVLRCGLRDVHGVDVDETEDGRGSVLCGDVHAVVRNGRAEWDDLYFNEPSSRHSNGYHMCVFAAKHPGSTGQGFKIEASQPGGAEVPAASASAHMHAQYYERTDGVDVDQKRPLCSGRFEVHTLSLRPEVCGVGDSQLSAQPPFL